MITCTKCGTPKSDLISIPCLNCGHTPKGYYMSTPMVPILPKSPTYGLSRCSKGYPIWFEAGGWFIKSPLDENSRFWITPVNQQLNSLLYITKFGVTVSAPIDAKTALDITFNTLDEAKVALNLYLSKDSPIKADIEVFKENVSPLPYKIIHTHHVLPPEVKKSQRDEPYDGYVISL